MKAIFFFILFSLVTSNSYSQSGWVQQSSGINSSLKSVYFINENTGWVAGDSGKILHTTNGGNNWIIQNSNTPRTIQRILFSDLNNGIAVGNYYEYNPWCLDNHIRLSTTNGGSQWNIQFEGYSNEIKDFTKTDNNTILIAYEGTDCYSSTGAIVKTTNNGMNWLLINTPPGGGYAYKSVNFINSQIGWAVGYRATDYGLRICQLIKTTDGGINWQYVRRDSNNLNQDYFGTNMRFYNSNTGYMFNYYNSTLRKTTNGGTTWNQTNSVTPVGTSAYYFVNPDTGWCVGTNGSIIRTNNGGANWTSQNSNVTNSLSSIYFVNNDVGYIVGTNGLILKTITGGLTSINQPSSTIPSSFILNQNYPNPFNPVTNLEFGISDLGFVLLKVYDITGKEVATLVNEKLSVGSYEVEFNANNLSGGIYFYSLYIDGILYGTKRMILLK